MTLGGGYSIFCKPDEINFDTGSGREARPRLIYSPDISLLGLPTWANSASIRGIKSATKSFVHGLDSSGLSRKILECLGKF